MAIVAMRKVSIRTLRSISILHPFSNSIGPSSPQLGKLSESTRWISRNGISTMLSGIQGIIHGNSLPFTQQHLVPWSPMVGASFSSTAVKDTEPPTEVVVELYQKMLKSLEARTMPPNAWLWSLIASCSNREDIKLLFEMLQKLRIFRLSNLRIHDNFNCHLCMRVSEACARASALDYGMQFVDGV